MGNSSADKAGGRINITPCSVKCGQSLRCAPLGGRTAPLRSAPCGFTEQALCLAPKPRAPAALRPAGQKHSCVFALRANTAVWSGGCAARRGEAPARPAWSAALGLQPLRGFPLRARSPRSRPPPRGLPESERRKGKGKPSRPLRGRGLQSHTKNATCHRPESEYPCASWPGSARRSPFHAPHRPMHISKMQHQGAGLHAVQAEDSPCTARASVSLGGRQG